MRVRFIAVYCLFFLNVLFGQENLSLIKKEQLKFEHLGVSDGLMHNSIVTILQDKKGYMWFGTSNGLYRYDGYNFVYYSNSPDDDFSLLSNEVNVLFEDSKGVIWVGTKFGLCYYNREEDLFISSLSIGSIEADKRKIIDPVRCIEEDKFGALWIGTRFGVYHINKNLDTSFNMRLINSGIAENTLSHNNINSIEEDDMGRLWLGTNVGLNLLRREKDSSFSFKRFLNKPGNKNSLSNNYVSKILKGTNGKLFIGTKKGLTVLEKDTLRGTENFKTYTYNKKNKNSIGNNNINTLTEDHRGNIWIGFRNKGLNKFNPANGKFNHCQNYTSQESKLRSNSITDLFVDNSGVLWVAAQRGWLSKLNIDRKKIAHYKYNKPNFKGLSSNLINSIYEDSKNNIWIGTLDNGLNRLTFSDGSPEFIKYKHDKNNKNSLIDNSVFAICEDNFGNYWISSQTDGISHVKMENDPKSNKIQSVFYNNKPSIKNFPSNKIAVLTKDNKGDIWSGSYDKGGLIKFTPTRFGEKKLTFLQYQHNPGNENSLTSSSISCIYEDSEGVLWVGTNGGGLNKILRDEFNNPEKFIRIVNEKNNSKSLSSNYVFSIHEDKKGNIWVGTFGGGLNKISKIEKNNLFPEIARYFKEDGVTANEIYGILEDEEDNLWISSNNGISVFNTKKETFEPLSLSDGIQSEIFRKHAYFKDSKGLMYFGGINGINVLDPSEMVNNSSLPRIEIVDFKIFNESVKVGEEVLGSVILKKSIEETSEIVLESKHNTFSFDFSGLHYVSPKDNQYKYKLEGFDKEWVLTNSTRRFAGYSNLESGTYKFRVKVSNNDNLWNEISKDIVITVLPPFWKTWWAYIIYALLIVFLMWLFRKYVLINQEYQGKIKIEKIEQEKIKEVNKIKLEFFTNVSHEFKTPLTLILGPLQRLIASEETSAKVRDSLLLMERNANQLFRLVNQIMEFRKVENKKLKLQTSKGDLINFCRDEVFSFKMLADKNKLDLSFECSEYSIEGYFDWDKIEKILNNLISNAINYTDEGGTIKVSLSILGDEKRKQIEDSKIESRFVRIIVEDTGIGIPRNQLSLIFERFHQIKSYSKEGVKGSGIGLALTKSLIELHKGVITVESEKNKGSRFIVDLPLLTNLKSHSQPVIGADRIINADKPIEDTLDTIKKEEKVLIGHEDDKPKLLLVEDNADMLEFISKELESRYKIYKAADGVKGLKKALKVIPDLIISDVMMPNMDGIEFCKHIKSDELTDHIPLILLTAKGTTEHLIEGLEVGADSYISKPFDMRHLEVRIKKLMDQRTALKEKFTKGSVKLDSQKVGINNTEKLFLEKVEKILEENLTNSEFKVDDLGNQLGYSRMQLYRKLKSIRGLSANEFIREYRIKKAAVYLRETDMKIFEVLYEIGISNHSYFTKCFKQYFNKSPKEYIEEYRGK